MSKKQKRSVDGILLLNKPQHVSSNQILQRVRWVYKVQKAGHAGTLDPFADGLLPILFGDATKFGQYLLGADKRYQVSIRFGFETDTDDCEGKPTLNKTIPNLKEIDWEKVFESFLGAQQQIPPIYSALKINGRRAYDLARAGEQPELASREIHIYELKLVDIEIDSIILEVHCSKGTYIRALARDIGRYIGSAAHAKSLTRLAVGDFSQEQGYDLENLLAINGDIGIDGLDSCLLPLEKCVAKLSKFSVPEEKFRFIRNGNDISVGLSNGEYALFFDQQFFGVGEVIDKRLYPRRLCRT